MAVSVLQILLLAIAAIVPSVFGVWQLRRSRVRFDRRWASIRQRQFARSVAVLEELLPLGHSNCQWSARSPHVRCAVNPMGPCVGCREYVAIDPDW